MPIDLSRTRTITPPEINTVLVRLVGCGNLGSAAGIALCRMGLEHFQLYDRDRVELANISTQQFGYNWVGVEKVRALGSELITINPSTKIHAVMGRFRVDATPAGNTFAPYTDTIMIAATDNMESRRLAWHSFVANGAVDGRGLFIDLRMALEDFEIWAVRHPNMPDTARDEYAAVLMDLEQTYDDAACGASSSGATGLGLTGYTTPIARRYLNGLSFPKHITGHFGRGKTNTYWRTNEPFVDEEHALAERHMAAGGRG